MVRGVSFSVVVAAWMLTGQHVEAGNISDGSQLYRAAIPVAVNGLEELIAHATSSIGGPGVKPPVDVGINAVIVSGTQSPWDAIGKVPGVGTVTVTGGIIALGKTPIPGEAP